MEKETMVATVPQAEIVDEQQLSRDVTDIEFQAESLVIQTDEDYAFAGEFGKMLKKKASQVTTFFKPMKDSAYQAHKAVCDREKAMLTPLRNAEKTVKQVMSDYIAEQERKRREAEEAARRAAEAERERKIQEAATLELSLIHISEPTRRTPISYAVFCLKKKKKIKNKMCVSTMVKK